MSPWYQNYWRLITHPYVFFEEAINHGKHLPATLVVFFTIFLTGFGWLLISPAQINLFNAAASLIIPICSYPAAVFLIFLVCRFLISETKLQSFFAVWGFSYVPTFIFFLINISVHGFQNFHWFQSLFGHSWLIMVFWAFIFLMFLWKVLFLAITLRLAGNLNLIQISIALPLLIFIAGIYWWILLTLGWIKVPLI